MYKLYKTPYFEETWWKVVTVRNTRSNLDLYFGFPNFQSFNKICFGIASLSSPQSGSWISQSYTKKSKEDLIWSYENWSGGNLDTYQLKDLWEKFK